MRATAQTNQYPSHFQQQSGAKMAVVAIKMETRSAQSEPKGAQRTPKGAQREPKGLQKGAPGRPKGIQISIFEIYPKNGALFPVLRYIL